MFLVGETILLRKTARMSPTLPHRSTTNSPTGLGWLLWVLVATLPWLQPMRGEPWPAFYSEAAVAAAMIPVAIWVLLQPGRLSLDALSVSMLLLATVPLLQAAAGLFVFAGEAVVVMLYLAAFALVLVVARRAEELAPGRLVDALLASVVVASLISVGFALYQWFQQDWLGPFVHFALIRGRAFANLGQPNNLATLLCWGLIGLWWGFARDKIHRAPALMAAAFLLVGVALTRSRTGALEVGLLAVAALYVPRQHATGPGTRAVAALLAWFAALVVGLEPLAQQLASAAPADLREQASTGIRPIIWRMALDEVWQRPWFGYGWNQGIVAHMNVADQYPGLENIVQHAHNLVLDLWVWNGLPLGLAIVGGLAWWSLRQWRACRTTEQRLLLLALGVLFTHCLLELPYAYLFFLLPAAVMMGTLTAWQPGRVVVAAPRSAVAAALVVMSVALLLIARDYRRIEDDLLAARMRAAQIHNPHPREAAHPLVLTYLHSALERLLAPPTAGLPDADFVQMRRTLARYPARGALFRYARVSALRGQPDEARWALERLCLLNPQPDCEQAMRDWRALAAQGDPAMQGVALPTAP